MSTRSESGLRRHRVEFAREITTDDAEAITPADPNWRLYADVVRSVESSLGATIEEQRGLGSPDPQNFFRGPEEPEMTVVYDLQQFFADGSGNPVDAAYDGLARDVDNLLPNSHTVVDRESKTGIAASNTVSGDESRDTRLFTVMVGGHVDEATLTGDPGDQQPVAVELSYMGELLRTYQIDQPEDENLQVSSTLDEDTTQSVTLESETGTPSVSLTLDGTTTVSSVDPFPDLDTVALDAQTEGDVVVETAGGTTLAIIHGKDSYGGIAGDVGIPATGAGSHASAIGQSYEQFIGDTITRDSGPLAMDINSFEFSVSNNCETRVRSDGFRQRVHPGDRETEISATTAGETESHRSWMQALLVEEADIDWTLTNGTITAPGASLTEPGDKTYETGQSSMTLDNTFTGSGVSLTASGV